MADEKKVVETKEEKSFVMPEFTFAKDVVVTTGAVENEIKDRVTNEVTGKWFSISVSDGKSFQLLNVTISKDCNPLEIGVFTRVKAYFLVSQKPNKKGGSGFVYDVRIVHVAKV